MYMYFEKTPETIMGVTELLTVLVLLIFQFNFPADSKIFGICFLSITGVFLLSTGMKSGSDPKKVKTGFTVKKYSSE